MKIYRLEEASEKKIKYINRHPDLDDEQKEKIIDLYIKQNIPDKLIDWNIFNSYSFNEIKEIAENYLRNREEKKNKKNSSKALEGRDFIKLFEKTNSNGTEYLYLPLTWLGSKYLASDHFLPKIKVPSKVMQANDFADNTAKNEELSPGAKWCISLWTLPDYVVNYTPVTDENGKELRHEGKRYWLDYTSDGYYFLFYFRDYSNLEDIDKKIAFTLVQGSSEIENITLADDTRGDRTPDINRVQEYWDRHYNGYESQIKHIREVSIENRPKFEKYEKQKKKGAIEYHNSQMKKNIFRDYLTYNDDTGRYDSKEKLNRNILQYLVKDGEFTVPLGVINGNFNCSDLGLETLKNGPTEVRGDFNCSFNRLTTLEYAPQKVEWSFNCGSNRLTNLKGAPKEVRERFDCSRNELITLEGAPEKVGEDFDCNRNALTSLEYAPKEVGGNFSCSFNNLTTLKGAPERVKWNFTCAWNELTTLEGAPEKVGGDFYCFNNPLQSKKLSTYVKGRIILST